MMDIITRCMGCHYLESSPMRCCAALPHVEPPQDCARDEAVLWLTQHYAGEGDENLDAVLQWLLGWAQRRNANQIRRAAEVLLDVAEGYDVDALETVAYNVAVDLIGRSAVAEYLRERRLVRATEAG